MSRRKRGKDYYFSQKAWKGLLYLAESAEIFDTISINIYVIAGWDVRVSFMLTRTWIPSYYCWDHSLEYSDPISVA